MWLPPAFRKISIIFIKISPDLVREYKYDKLHWAKHFWKSTLWLFSLETFYLLQAIFQRWRKRYCPHFADCVHMSMVEGIEERTRERAITCILHVVTNYTGWSVDGRGRSNPYTIASRIRFTLYTEKPVSDWWLALFGGRARYLLTLNTTDPVRIVVSSLSATLASATQSSANFRALRLQCEPTTFVLPRPVPRPS